MCRTHYGRGKARLRRHRAARSTRLSWRTDIGEIVVDYDVIGCAYDRWRIDEIKRLLADAAIKLAMIEWGQGFKDSAPALDAIETLVVQGKLRHSNNPVMNWNVANAVTLTDPAGGRKLAKDRSTGRIDGLVAASMACGLASRAPPPRKSVYQTRGLLTVPSA